MPGIVDMFCNQVAIWEKKIPDTQDIHGNPQYQSPVDIKVRFVRERKTHEKPPGNIVITTRSILAKNRLHVGDVITHDGDRVEIAHEGEIIWIGGTWWGAWYFG